MSNEKKVKSAAFRIAFLMPHQQVTEELELEAMALLPVNEEPPPVNKASPEYLAGASDALLFFIESLRKKGPPTKL
jgi:hypothetical protein